MNKILCKSHRVNTPFKENRTFRLWMVRGNESVDCDEWSSVVRLMHCISVEYLYNLYNALKLFK